MIKLSFVKTVEHYECIKVIGDNILVKKGNVIQLLDKNMNFLKGNNEFFYVEKMLIDDKKEYVVPVTSMFKDHCNIYSLKNLSLVMSLKEINGKRYFYKDATFVSNSSVLYLLLDEDSLDSETILLKVDLNYQNYETYFIGEGLNFSSLTYVKDRFVLALMENNGRIYYFNEGKIIKKVKTHPFSDLFFIDNGEIYLSDSTHGFILSSNGGKVLRNCDFLPLLDSEHDNENKKNKKVHLEEIYFDMCVSDKLKRLFFISYEENEDKYFLYVYSLKTFALRKRIKLKGKILSVEFDDPYLYIRKPDSIDVYSIVEKHKQLSKAFYFRRLTTIIFDYEKQK